MKVIKIGGGCLQDRETVAAIVDLMQVRGPGQVFVVSALGGVTDQLIAGMTAALDDEAAIPGLMRRLKSRHLRIARHVIAGREVLNTFSRNLTLALNTLERLYYGLNFTREITPRTRDVISSFGERLSAELLACALRARGADAAHRLPHRIGLITDGRFGDATADMAATRRNFARQVHPLLAPARILFIPGFYGVSSGGDITTFGRGGSDYSAAVVAAALGAEVLEIWKDVDGFMSADPKFVPEARLIPQLSYAEAAELAYFGAKILHPRTMEPIRPSRVPVAIKNTLAPDAPGTLITSRSRRPASVIKSVAYDTAIGILKVHASGVGARPGILARVAGELSDAGINIKSVVTSQTCISLLLDRTDMEHGWQALHAMRPRPFRRLERVADVALIGIVGQGLLQRRGIAARCFTAVAGCNVNVEMISFGPSRVALYFLTRTAALQRAVAAIHSSFFATPRCT